LAKAFIPVIETPNQLQFFIKGLVFTIFNESGFYLKEAYWYSLIGFPIIWQREVSYLRGLQKPASYQEIRRLGGLITKSGYEFSVLSSYDATRFYVSIAYTLTDNTLMPKG